MDENNFDLVEEKGNIDQIRNAIVEPEMIKMIPYNTGMEPLLLAEYGRNIQNLVDYCLSIEDREERTRCAYAIADIMTILFPALKKDPNDRKKIWDHINIMSRFELDIDFPVPVIQAEEANPIPEPVPYSNSRDIIFRYYGKHIQEMVRTVADMEDSEERYNLIGVIANHMKKLMLAHNKEAVSDLKVFNDLRFISDGKIDLMPGDIYLYDFQEVQQPPKQKQGKKKNKQNY
ncbi:MAG: DUF4290 domain-containing protein [Muribaculaceae bacterium]|nr:DUF4290 domain-containing protein [Muribaculaceae bacterium]